MMGTKVNSNYEDLLTFTRASKGHALRPVSYGTELVTNGTFNSDTSDWDINDATRGTAVVSSGRAVLTNDHSLGSSSGFVAIIQDITTVIGNVYKYTANCAGTAGISASNNSSGASAFAQTTGTGDKELIFTASATTTYIVLYVASGSDAATANFDNISIKEVTFDQPDGTLTLFEHPDDVPRVEWDSAGNRLGLLVEEQRTNLLRYSEDFSNTPWSIFDSGDTLTANAAIAPDKTQTAYLFAPDSSGTIHILRHSFLYSATTYTISVFLKAAGRRYCRVFFGGATLGTPSLLYRQGVFDLENGTVYAEPTNGSARIEAVGDEWYRCFVTVTIPAGGQAYVDIGHTDESDPTSTVATGGNGIDGFYVWGAQLEEGSFPTSYMKNEGTVSGKDRSADVASIPVADFGWNNKAGTVVAEVDTADASNFGILWSANADSFQNRTLAYINNDLIYMYNRKNNGTEVNDPFTNAPLDNTPLKHGYAFTDGDFNHTLNGATVESVASNEMPVGINSFDIGNRLYTSGGHLNGHIKSIKYYPRRLTNAQLQDITT